MIFDNLTALLVASGTTILALFTLNFLAPIIKLVDHPDDLRKLHDGRVPLTGGIAILTSLIVAFLFLHIDPLTLGLPADFWFVTAVLLTTLTLTHAIDDVIELNAWVRIAIDASLALLLATLSLIMLNSLGDLFGMGEVTLGRWAIFMTMFCFIAASNALNMTDGIDGLCSGLGMVGAATLLALLVVDGNPASEPLRGALLVVIFAILPFYFANLGLFGKHMRTFLGDSGARMIGFVLAICIICAAEKGYINPVMAFFPIAIPVCDCLVLMAVRMFHGRSPFSADRRHLHHLLQDSGLTHAQSRRVALAMGVVLALTGVYIQANNFKEWIVSGIVVLLFASYIGLRFWLSQRASEYQKNLDMVRVTDPRM